MFIHVRFEDRESCKIRLLNKPPKRIGNGVVEYVERENISQRAEELKTEYVRRGFKVEFDSWSPLSSSVYVIILSPEARYEKKMIEQNDSQPDDPKGYLYVGMTGLTIEERIGNHLKGYKSCNLVKRYFSGVFTEKNECKLTHEEAKVREPALAEELRREGYWVYQN